MTIESIKAGFPEPPDGMYWEVGPLFEYSRSVDRTVRQPGFGLQLRRRRSFWFSRQESYKSVHDTTRIELGETMGQIQVVFTPRIPWEELESLYEKITDPAERVHVTAHYVLRQWEQQHQLDTRYDDLHGVHK